MIRMRVVTALLAAGLLASQALAWGYKEHVQFVRLAAMRLLARDDAPEDLKQWLRASMPELRPMEAERDFFMTARIGGEPRGLEGMAWWTSRPDIHANTLPRDSTVEPFGVHERLLHYVDLELFHREQALRRYRHDLSGLPDLTDVVRDPTDPRFAKAGYLPFAVEHAYRQLVAAIREGRLRPAAPDDDDHAMRWAGYLAHYAADNTQPHHATLDYKSLSYFAYPAQAPNIHSEMEWRMNDDEKQDLPDLRAEFWEAFVASLDRVVDPAESSDPWLATLEVARHSYRALPLIGEAAMAAAGQKGTPLEPQGRAGPADTTAFFHHRGEIDGRETTVLQMKADQTALAVRRIERLWLAAWREATASNGGRAATGPSAP